MTLDQYRLIPPAAQHTRRTLLRRIGASTAVLGVLAVAGCTPTSSDTAATNSTSSALPGPTPNLPAGDMSRGAANFYTSDQVSVQPVTFKNQYGMNVAGNLFVPNDIDRNTTNPAIVVGHPMGAVKEQSANLYATKMAERGFVTMSLDLSFWGHSDGQPRNAVSPDIYAEDFSAAVDYLRTQSFVDTRTHRRPRESAAAEASSSARPRSTRASSPWPRSACTTWAQPTATGCATPSPSISARQILQQAAEQRDVEFGGGADRLHRRHPVRTHRPIHRRSTGSSTTSTAPPAATAPTPPPSRR